jgi:hypothetical protein
MIRTGIGRGKVPLLTAQSPRQSKTIVTTGSATGRNDTSANNDTGANDDSASRTKPG